MCSWDFHVIAELVRLHREAAASFLYAVLGLWFWKLLISSFALLLLPFLPPVASLFGTFGAELWGARGALSASAFVINASAFCSGCSCCCLNKERQGRNQFNCYIVWSRLMLHWWCNLDLSCTWASSCCCFSCSIIALYSFFFSSSSFKVAWLCSS